MRLGESLQAFPNKAKEFAIEQYIDEGKSVIEIRIKTILIKNIIKNNNIKIMKDIKDYIVESTQSEDLHEEIGLALREFGNLRNGFKMAKLDDIKDAMYKIGFDFVEKDSSDDKLVFVGEYIDTKYEVTLYGDDHVSGKFKIKNFNEIEA